MRNEAEFIAWRHNLSKRQMIRRQTRRQFRRQQVFFIIGLLVFFLGLIWFVGH